MDINTKIFKAYDIRGIYPNEINEQVAYFVGRAFIKYLKKFKPSIVVARDNRLSSSPLHDALLSGLSDQGAIVIDIGLATTPMLYWTCAHYGFDGGISVTASHNPPEYGGLKMVREKAIPVGEGSGMKEIMDMVLKNDFDEKEKGEIRKQVIISDYIKFNLKALDDSQLKPLNFVVDTGNAVPSILVPFLQKEINGKIVPLFAKLDGTFPNHLPNPLIEENIKDLKEEVKNNNADFGVAFDGDGDRVIFVDEKGKMVPPDFITALIAQNILKDNPDRKVLYDLRSSNIVKKIISDSKGVPIMGRVGHSFIKDRMRKENIIFAGEYSGHYYLQDHYFCEAPLFVLFIIMKEVSKSEKSFSELLKPLQFFYHSGEINFEVKNKEEILKELEGKYKNGEVSHLDGLRIDFNEWWFNVRLSQTEPLLRLVIEANTKELMEQKRKELTDIITSSD